MGEHRVRVTQDSASRWRRRAGDYETLQEALAAAEPGDTVTVRPGTFREAVLVDKALTLRAAEGPGSVRIDPPAGVPLTVSAAAAVHGLVIEGSDRSLPAVLVTADGARLTDCRIDTQAASGVEIADNASAVLRGCTVANPAGLGVRLRPGARAGLQECEVSAAGQAGLAVLGGAAAVLERCRLHHAAGAGLLLTGEGSGAELTGCEIYEIRGSGVQAEDGAVGRLTDCSVHRVTGNGLTLDTGAELRLTGCRIHELPENAADLRGRSRLQLDGCTLHDFGRGALSVWDAGTEVAATASEIPSSDGDYPAVWVSDGARLSLRDCALHDLPDALFVLDRESVAEAADCSFSRIRASAVSVSGGATADLADCRIQEAGTGLWFRDHGSGGLLTGCEISDVATGVIVAKGADPVLRGCTVRGAGDAGVYVSAQGRGNFEDCRVSHGRGFGFHVIDGCRTVLTRCRAEQNGRSGFEFSETGPITEGCVSDDVPPPPPALPVPRPAIPAPLAPALLPALAAPPRGGAAVGTARGTSAA
ncbi:right-handed parallel beta-helix repeat-containing protein, partial [Kitasatospora sp. NPDC059571]|uniref:right-handed parallel beta-helix repeat-containing protein n=1 Tax=Kitasatospora sp. NPDC059571 TaxID=3346871 RepID=UPI0036C0190E